MKNLNVTGLRLLTRFFLSFNSLEMKIVLILGFVLIMSGSGYSRITEYRNLSAMNSVAVNDSVYEQVDVLPYLKNHKRSTAKHLRKEIDYPSILKLKGIEANVVVSFVVNGYGQITSATILEGEVVELNEETLKSILNSGPWVPAKVNGQSVSCRMSMVIPFELTPEERNYATILKPIDFDKKPPLFVLDGKIVSTLMQIDDYNVKSVRVIKGEKAVAMYGERGANGVVEFTSKNGTPAVR